MCVWVQVQARVQLSSVSLDGGGGATSQTGRRALLAGLQSALASSFSSSSFSASGGSYQGLYLPSTGSGEAEAAVRRSLPLLQLAEEDTPSSGVSSYGGGRGGAGVPGSRRLDGAVSPALNDTATLAALLQVRADFACLTGACVRLCLVW